MNVAQSFRQLLDRHIVSQERKRNFKVLERMTDRELNDIGLPREQLYMNSANQRRHTVSTQSSRKGTSVRSQAA